ncbi:MAG: hypothetical protein RQ756_05635 [Flavobacteriaceae bacterium]|nr:hypothetical protein [Flavobacteriaceae bacterium]
MTSASNKFKIQTPFRYLLSGWGFLFLIRYVFLAEYFSDTIDFFLLAFLILTVQPIINHFFNVYVIHENKITFGKSAMQPEIAFDKIEKIEVVERDIWMYFLGLPRKHLKVHYKSENISQTYPIYNTSKKLLNLLPKEKLFSAKNHLTVS